MFHHTQTSFLLLTIGLLAGLCSVNAAQFSTAWPLQEFKSTSVQAPYMNVTKMGQNELGFLFLSPADIIRHTGHPSIYSDDGQLIWQGSPGNYSALQPQLLDGEPVITFWSGFPNPEGFGFGSISIVNTSYQEIYQVTLDCEKENFVTVYGNQSFNSCIDIHESYITQNGTILVTAVNVTKADLTSVGGPKDGWIQDGLIYEIDIKSNEILFRWSAHQHPEMVPLNESQLALGDLGRNQTNPYGYAHLNSIAKYGDNYLLSSRYLCGVWLIAPNGTALWNLNGFHGGDFQLVTETSFCYQHDVRFQSQDSERVTISMHNNENTGFSGSTSQTTGLLLGVELQGSKQVTLQRRMWDSADPVYSTSQGSYQALGNGHVLINQGAVPKIEEYDESGSIVMRAWFGFDNDENMMTYRAYRYPWVGRPTTKPDVAVCTVEGGGNVMVYVSWNGATDVQAWNVFSKQKLLTTAIRNGFETAILVNGLGIGDSVSVMADGGVGNGTWSNSVVVKDVC